MSDRGDPFEWSGGHPALDLVNTLDERPFDEPVENLAAYRDLVRFTELAGLVEPALAATLRTRTGSACARVQRRGDVHRTGPAVARETCRCGSGKTAGRVRCLNSGSNRIQVALRRGPSLVHGR